MVAWIPVIAEEAFALDNASVGQESEALAAVKAVQNMSALPTTTDSTSFILQPSEQETLVPHKDFSTEIPVIDFSGIMDDARRDATIAAIVDAATSWGVFQIVNHCIPATVMEEVMALAKEFFAMPEEDQMTYAIDYKKGVMQGFRPMSQAFQRNASWSNQLDYILRPQRLSPKPDEFPSTPAAFRTATEEYGKELNNLLSQFLELLLGAYLGTTSGKHKSNELMDADHMQVLRMVSYVPCPQPDVVMGLRSHVDTSLITGLVQDDTGGLQVEKDGQWHGVPPLPGAIVIMMGTAIQIVTNDNIKAVNHRAVVNGHTSRLSVTTAVNPSNDKVICPAPQLIDEMHPALYRSCTYGEFRIASFESGALKSSNVMKKFSTRAVSPESRIPTAAQPDADQDQAVAAQYEGDGRLRDLMSFVRQGIVAA